MKSENIVWHETKIRREDRLKLLGNKNKVLWFTGLSGCGKSTLANELARMLHEDGKLCYILDGDNIRHGLNSNLGFSPEDREENIRRIGEVSKLLYDAGVTVLACFISPYRKDRDQARNLIGEDFIEIFVKCDPKECERRDPKGLYKKARAGELQEFTGISAPYEEPENPEITVDTTNSTEKECVEQILTNLKSASQKS